MDTPAIRAITFDAAFVQHLSAMGIEHVPQGTFPVHTQTFLEAPASLYGLDLWAHPARIGAFTYFGPGQFFNAEIGRYCSVGAGLKVGLSRHPVDHLTTSPVAYLNFGNFQSYFEKRDPGFTRSLPPPYAFDMRPRTFIGNDVWIGADVYIKDGLTIGDGAIIGAGSVVTHDVPPYHIVGGAPAKTLRLRFPEPVIERLLSLKWWNYNIYEFTGVNARDAENSIDIIQNLIDKALIRPYPLSHVNLCELYDEYLKNTEANQTEP